jgi:hypothetical protein
MGLDLLALKWIPSVLFQFGVVSTWVVKPRRLQLSKQITNEKTVKTHHVQSYEPCWGQAPLVCCHTPLATSPHEPPRRTAMFTNDSLGASRTITPSLPPLGKILLPGGGGSCSDGTCCFYGTDIGIKFLPYLLQRATQLGTVPQFRNLSGQAKEHSIN